MARTLARILELTLNGRPRVDAVPDNLLLLDYLREVVGLTGTKTGCDGGECGACTVLVDDQPRLSCLTLAAGVRGQRVDTVESLGEDGHLSAVQRGFHEKLGAQCGYCTPGFIMASAGLLRRNPRPSEDDIRRGAGQQHLPLHRLRQNHRGGEVRRRAQRRRSGAVNEIVPTHNIGGYVPMVDGPEKVSGRAKYTADLIAPGMLAGRIFRSPYSHAEIIDVDVSAALQLPGVKAIVTGADCDKTFGVLPIARSEHPLARDKVRYRGEPVAAVAAVDDATAKRAIALIKLKVRELPAYYTLAGGDGRGRDASSMRARPGNIERDVLFELGNVEQGFGERRSRARRPLRLRRGLPEPDGDARRDRRVRRRARAHDRACQHAGPLLRAPDARADPRHGHVEDPRDQAACRRRLRLPHRSAQCRADHRAARAPRRRQRAHDDQPRGDLHHPSRPAADRHPPQARHAQGRQDHRGGMRMLPARRRPFRLRRGDHPLCRLDAVRDLRPAQRQIYRQARAHQHAAVRRVPRPRHRRRPLRLREPARRDGAASSGSTRWRCGARTTSPRPPSPTTT